MIKFLIVATIAIVAHRRFKRESRERPHINDQPPGDPRDRFKEGQ
jgi:hypothetical protein